MSEVAHPERPTADNTPFIVLAVLVALGVSTYFITGSVMAAVLVPLVVPIFLIGVMLWAQEDDRRYYGSTRDANGRYRWRGEN